MATTDLWGVTETGFYRPTLEDIIKEREKKAKEIFGEDFNTDEKTVQGKYFRINAASESKLCEIAEGIYYSIFPSTSRGISLDRVCEFANLTRENKRYAVHELKVYGTQGYVISAGTLFKTESGLEFYSTADAVITNNELGDTLTWYALVGVQCTESGEIGNVTNITALKEVDVEIQKVQHQRIISRGTEIETDPELRRKFGEVVQGMGTNTNVAIKANVLRVEGVNNVIIYNNSTENDIPLTDVNTPFYVRSGTYAIVVQSDSILNAEEIAKAIFEKQPLGIGQSGKETIAIKDESGIEQIVQFSYVTELNPTVDISCVVSREFPIDGKELIAGNITSYINGLGIGEEVVYSRLYDCIYNVSGVHKVNSLKLNGVQQDFPIPTLCIAKVGEITISATEG